MTSNMTASYSKIGITPHNKKIDIDTMIYTLLTMKYGATVYKFKKM